jgi:hypothetical protein
MTNSLRWLILPLAALSVAACSSDEPGPKTSAEDALRTEALFCNAWAKAACNDDVVSNCDEVDKATCVQHQAAFCQGLIPFGYSPKRAQECLDAVKAAYADAELEADELDTVLHLGGDCSHLVAGVNVAGESCSEPTDCNTVKDYSCVIKAGEQTGTCQIPMVQANGEACDADAMVCNDEAYCDGYNCLVKRKTGKACTYDAMCAAGDRCDIPTDSTDGSGTCGPKLDLKQACTADAECASDICLAGKCTSKVVLTSESSLCVDL